MNIPRKLSYIHVQSHRKLAIGHRILSCRFEKFIAIFSSRYENLPLKVFVIALWPWGIG